MSQYLIAEPAERDLFGIAEYLCEHSLQAAKSYRRKFISRFELLAKFPNAECCRSTAGRRHSDGFGQTVPSFLCTDGIRRRDSACHPQC